MTVRWQPGRSAARENQHSMRWPQHPLSREPAAAALGALHARRYRL